MQAQSQLTGALSRLLVVAENYPNLKSDALFRDLQSQLEGTENRITVARNRYIDTVQEYNTTVRSFPTNLTAMVFEHEREARISPSPNEAVDQRAAEGRLRPPGAGRRARHRRPHGARHGARHGPRHGARHGAGPVATRGSGACRATQDFPPCPARAGMA